MAGVLLDRSQITLPTQQRCVSEGIVCEQPALHVLGLSAQRDDSRYLPLGDCSGGSSARSTVTWSSLFVESKRVSTLCTACQT